MRGQTLWRRQVPSFVCFLYGAIAVRSLLPDTPWLVTLSRSALIQRAIVSLTVALLLYIWAGRGVRRSGQTRHAA
jgi:hypothetical protein